MSNTILTTNEETNVDFENNATSLTSDPVVDSQASTVIDQVDRRRRFRRQCPDFFDVVTPDYDVVDGGYIRNLREGINVTRKVFGQILGVTEETVVDWEDDVKRPNNCALRLLFLLNNHIKLTGELFAIQMKKINNFKKIYCQITNDMI